MKPIVFVLFAVAPALAGCVMIDAKGAANAKAPQAVEHLEPLLALTASRDALTARVSTNGCTHKEDFATLVDKADGAAQVSFIRKTADLCRSFRADSVELTWTYAELGLEPTTPVQVQNRFKGQ